MSNATLDDILCSHRTRRPVVMGILNVTPDSFSDGGRFATPEIAIEHARRMVEHGADVIDIGAESTRPGAAPVPAAQQIERLRPVLPAVVAMGRPVSVDTADAAVAEFALGAGAAIINDVTAGRGDPDMLPLVARRSAAIVLMHMLGEPRTMQAAPQYDDVLAQVRGFLADRAAATVAAGVAAERIIVDPGIGFGKTMAHNLTLLAGTRALVELGHPVLIGVSRKRFIGELTATKEPHERLAGSVAAAVDAFTRGATIFRVHDVAATRQALAVAKAILDT